MTWRAISPGPHCHPLAPQQLFQRRPVHVTQMALTSNFAAELPAQALRAVETALALAPDGGGPGAGGVVIAPGHGVR
jgi:hypothetical protein